jgi:sulfhydrogenase subunit beta (sulfur reductase)
MQRIVIDRRHWDSTLEQLTDCSPVYASVEDEYGQDYELLTKEQIPAIVYNKPKPVTPLKNLFLPVRENVSRTPGEAEKRLILGAPNCDLEGLRILDEIYLDPDFQDTFYRKKRENTTIITTDCFSLAEHCHCTTYGIQPFTEHSGDLSLAQRDGTIILTAFSEKGMRFLAENHLVEGSLMPSDQVDSFLAEKHAGTVRMLADRNRELPDYPRTGKLVRESTEEIWKKYAQQCVACGACTAICPTCSCFLLIDRPGFEKVKQLDACQYPGFERVAGGEDVLHARHVRFRNRYLCKYVWKPEKFRGTACTGCGRCIEACIGKISKNELFVELAT